jgi:hypothetical protein
MHNGELINEIIGNDDECRVLVTSENLKEKIKANEVVYEEKTDAKRYYHYVVIDKKVDIKEFFRALRNGGYLISLIELDENELYDIGFSAISRVDGLLIAKKVHSWNDW